MIRLLPGSELSWKELQRGYALTNTKIIINTAVVSRKKYHVANPACMLPAPVSHFAPKETKKDSTVIIRFGHRFCHPMQKKKAKEQSSLE